MGPENGNSYYEEVEVTPVARVIVRDVNRFIEVMLRYFTGKGTLYVSSYDFGYWLDRLSCFSSGERVKLKTSLPDPAFLANGLGITDEFIYVFSIDCLKNIDAKSMFNQFLIYEKGRPLLQCCGNFEDVYVNVKIPQRIIKTLTEDKTVDSWEKAPRASG